MPQRIQLKRTKGWRMPPNTVKVSRPSDWGNPWHIGRDGDAAYCVEQYRRCMTGLAVEAWPNDHDDTARAVMLPDETTAAALLHGKNLACWCKQGEPCHADVLLELANALAHPTPARRDGGRVQRIVMPSNQEPT